MKNYSKKSNDEPFCCTEDRYLKITFSAVKYFRSSFENKTSWIKASIDSIFSNELYTNLPFMETHFREKNGFH